MRKLLILMMTLLLALAAGSAPAGAKTVESARADHVFFYATNDQGRAVLLKVIPLDELKALAHGQANGDNYFISATDNYPTTQYGEARGFTVIELLDYVKAVTPANDADRLAFAGGDSIRLMATDGYGNYSRSWIYDQLYGIARYYFEDLYDPAIGWNTGWEIADEDGSKFGLSLEEYNAGYATSDPYYEDKRAVFSGGAATTVILSTESYSGRTTVDALGASTEPGIASYIAANGGTVAGSLRDALSDEHALRLWLPMTEADLMAAHRTAFDNFKWICNLSLHMASAPALRSLGTVAAPAPAFSLQRHALTVSLSCATPGAQVYYGLDGAPQTLYTGPITLDVAGRDLASDPVTIYAAAVKEGWDDAGVLSFKYPGMAPNFQTLYSGMAGDSLTFTVASDVSAGDWAAWTHALNFITMKTPAVNGYLKVNASDYNISNDDRAITFDRSLFAEPGSYSFIFHATEYADKSLSVTMKKAAPPLNATDSYIYGQTITLRFDDPGYHSSLSVYVTPAGGDRAMISSGYLDRTVAGQISIRPEYFALPSAAITGAGNYSLELVNNSYSPSAQTVELCIATGFTDVPASAWYYPYVSGLSATGVISGMGDGSFQPEGAVTWGQALKLLLLTTGFEEQPPTADHWAGGYLSQAAEHGITDYNGDLDALITRLDFCRAAAQALNATSSRTDSPFSDTADPAVLALYELEIIAGMSADRFVPEGNLTRAQISKIIWSINDWKENTHDAP